MIKTVTATFDGKVYVPEDATGIPVGTKVVFTVDLPSGKSPREILETIRGKMSKEEAEMRLKQLYERREADIETRRAHQ